ncbi:MAG: hypothetical protein NTV52_00180 [Acidobacteria bacterium]|nr:hypothetical protein [Acidobacteriota bacterium]
MKIKSISVGVVSFLCVGLIGVTPAAAVTKGTPPKPIVTLIRSAPAPKGKVNLTFVIATTESKNKPTSTVVALANYAKSCTIRGKATSCTIKNIGARKVLVPGASHSLLFREEEHSFVLGMTPRA